MFDLKDLASAKKKVTKIRVEVSGSAYEEAVKSLENFEKNPDSELLRESAKKLIDSLQFNPSHPPSYVCLAYIFYVLDENEFALKYIDKAESLSGSLPEKLLAFRQKIIAGLPWLQNQSESQSSQDEIY